MEPLSSISDPKPFRLPTYRCTSTLLVIIAGTFLAVGGAMLSSSLAIVTKHERYDNVGSCRETLWNSPQNCSLTLDLSDKMSNPVFLYYELTNFFQNNRYYLRSVSWEQLGGTILDEDQIGICKPVRTMGDLGRLPAQREGAFDLGNDAVANPCGLIAKTVFNDTFELVNSAGQTINLTTDDLVLSEVSDRFSKDSNWQEIQWTDVEAVNFEIWMEASGLPLIRKLWAKSDVDLQVGAYTLQVTSNYNQNDFSGQKWVYLSTTSTFGGDQRFLSLLLLTNGAIFFAFAIYFLIKGFRAK